jgi:hypothetical protein
MTTLALIVLGSLGFVAFAIGVVVLIATLVAKAARTVYNDEPDPVIPRYTYRYDKADEALAARTRKRREAADAIHTRAHKVESGTKVADVLKLVKK